MQQPGQAFDGRLLIPLAPRQLGLVPGLSLQDGPDKGADAHVSTAALLRYSS